LKTIFTGSYSLPPSLVSIHSFNFIADCPEKVENKDGYKHKSRNDGKYRSRRNHKSKYKNKHKDERRSRKKAS
jgi:hypothetical protein